MKVVSVSEKGTLVEFENLVQHARVIGVMEPVRMLTPTEEFAQFQEVSRLAEQAGREAAERTKRIFAEMMDDASPYRSETVR